MKKNKIVAGMFFVCMIFIVGCSKQEVIVETKENTEIYEDEEVKDSSDGNVEEYTRETIERSEISESSEADKIVEEKSSLNIPAAKWEDLTFETSKVNSINNSNHVNMGYLCYDGNDYIYYVNFEENSIYCSHKDGSELTEIFEVEDEKINYMQVDEDYLYFNTSKGICRIQRESLQTEVIYSEPHGEFLVYQNNIYINTEEGLVRQNTITADREIMWEYDGYYPVLWNMAGNKLIGTVVSDQSMDVYGKGYLISFDLDEKEVSLLGESCFNTIVSGKEFITYDAQKGAFQVWNTETDSIQELRYVKNLSVRPVTNGEEVYFAETKYNESEESMETVLYCRNNEGMEKVYSELLEEDTWVAGLFSADDYVYILKQDSTEGYNNFVWHYYCTTNGQAGVLK